MSTFACIATLLPSIASDATSRCELLRVSVDVDCLFNICLRNAKPFSDVPALGAMPSGYNADIKEAQSKRHIGMMLPMTHSGGASGEKARPRRLFLLTAALVLPTFSAASSIQKESLVSCIDHIKITTCNLVIRLDAYSLANAMATVVLSE